MEQAVHTVAVSVQRALQQLQDAVLEAFNKSPNSTQDVHARVSELSTQMRVLLQRHAVLEQSLQDRDEAVKGLRQVISKNEAHAARLQSEVNRLRRHTQLLTVEADSQQILKPVAPDQSASSACDPEARTALLESAIAAKDKPEATIIKLESEVSACQDRIMALEAQLAEATISNSSRIAEQQRAFLAKVEQLRQVHSQQLAAAMQMVQAQQQEQHHAYEQLEQRMEQAKRREQEQQDLISDLQQQLFCSQQQNHLEQHAAVSSADTTAGTCDSIATYQVQAVKCTETAAAAATAAATDEGRLGRIDLHPVAACAHTDDMQAEASALQLMEQQLARLSGIIRAHQGEIKQLQQTVLDGFAERQQLQKQLQDLQQQQDASHQQSACMPGALRAVGGIGAATAASGRKLSSRH